MKAKVTGKVHVNGEWPKLGAVVDVDANTLRNLAAKGLLEAAPDESEEGTPKPKKEKP